MEAGVKLDQTFIAIRERNTLEILDLALQVVRRHFVKLFWLLLIGAAPWLLIDWLLLHQLLSVSYIGDSSFPFYWLMMVLVVSQAQVGTAMITYYLGQTMFIEEMSVTQIVRESFWKNAFYWWLHGGLRLVWPTLGLVVLAWFGGWVDPSSMSILATLVAGVGVVVRASRPFVTEILLLEKTPVRVKVGNRIDFSRRSANLHQNASTELLSRFLVGCFFYPILCFSIYSAFNLLDDAIALQASFEFPLRSIYWTMALWLTVGYAAVARFLSYIDVRIRQEGWAVELRMRAEGMRLAGGDAQ
jgi:hypothetical protein